MNEQRDKDPPCRGRGRSIAAGNSAAPRRLGDRGRCEQYIEDEERLEMTGYTTDAISDTPQHISEFDGRYMRDFEGEIIMRPPDDSHQHAVINHSKSWMLVEDTRGINPYTVRKDLGIDYRFWNEFHFNLYAIVILASKKTKIIKI